MEKAVFTPVSTLVNKDIVSKQDVKSLIPVGSHLSHIYGLPKTQKLVCPVRLILSMSGTPAHHLAEVVASVFSSVRDAVSHTVKFLKFLK